MRHHVAVDEVVLGGQNGRALTLRRVTRRDDESFWSYESTLAIPEGQLRTVVYDHGKGLAQLFADLAGAWRSFEGAKEYATLEGQLELSCTHDGRGTVECRVVLRQPWPPDWRAEAVLEFGAGAHLERLAADLYVFVEGDGAEPQQLG